MSTSPRSKSSKKLPRNPSTGQFELDSPLNNPALLDQSVRWVRAIDEILPLLKAFAGESNRDVAGVAALSAMMLQTLKDTALDALAVDPDSLRRAKKSELKAPHFAPRSLGGTP